MTPHTPLQGGAWIWGLYGEKSALTDGMMLCMTGWSLGRTLTRRLVVTWEQSYQVDGIVS